MKKLLLPVLACGMFANAFAQPEISEKWVITPVPNMKGVLGRLDINFPADVERNILIYQQADNKFLTSVSRNDKIYSIAPGEYRFTLTNVPVENVPIQKGHETRLKAGFLDVVSEGDWHLYDETKEKAYTSGNKPKKLPLPVGSYQIKLGGQFFPVIIKDGKTVEDYTPIGIEENSDDKEEQIAIENNSMMTESIEQDKWVITPLPGSKGIEKNEPGMLEINFLNDLPQSGRMKISRSGYADILLSSDDFQNTIQVKSGVKSATLAYPLSPGTYQIKLNNVMVENVLIKSGMQTRIKTGTLKVNSTSPAPLYDAQWKLLKDTVHLNDVLISGQGDCSITVPLGVYRLMIYKIYPSAKIDIRDGKTINVDAEFVQVTVISNKTTWQLKDVDEKNTQSYGSGGLANGADIKTIIVPVGDYIFKCSSAPNKVVAIYSPSQQVTLGNIQ